jgi:hypothetical protein
MLQCTQQVPLATLSGTLNTLVLQVASHQGSSTHSAMNAVYLAYMTVFAYIIFMIALLVSCTETLTNVKWKIISALGVIVLIFLAEYNKR